MVPSAQRGGPGESVSQGLLLVAGSFGLVSMRNTDSHPVVFQLTGVRARAAWSGRGGAKMGEKGEKFHPTGARAFLNGNCVFYRGEAERKERYASCC